MMMQKIYFSNFFWFQFTDEDAIKSKVSRIWLKKLFNESTEIERSIDIGVFRDSSDKVNSI